MQVTVREEREEKKQVESISVSEGAYCMQNAKAKNVIVKFMKKTILRQHCKAICWYIMLADLRLISKVVLVEHRGWTACPLRQLSAGMRRLVRASMLARS